MGTKAISCVVLFFILFAGSLYSQENTSCLVTTPTAEGVSLLGSYRFGTIEAINLQNGIFTLNIPLLSLDGREMDTGISLIYNSRIWIWRDPIRPGALPTCSMKPQRYDGLPAGWQLNIPKMRYRRIVDSGSGSSTYTEYTLVENGAEHNFTNELKIGYSGSILNYIQKGYTYDSTYMTFNMPDSSLTNYVLGRDGKSIFFRGLFGRPSRYPLKIEDTNGNFINLFVGSEEGFTGPIADLITSIEDTLGRRIRFNYEIVSTRARLYSIEYTDVNGSIRHIQFHYGTVTVNWEGKDWGNPYQHVNYETEGLTEIVLPNGLSYEFEYEVDFNQGRGLVTSIIMPTGGRIRCTYGKAELPGDSMRYDVAVKREEIENTVSNAWHYQYNSSTSYGPGTYPLATSVIDPVGNQTDNTFLSTTGNGDLVEAKREIYEGSGESKSLSRSISLSWDTSDSFPSPISRSVQQAYVCVNSRVTRETKILYDTSPPQGHSISYNYNIGANPRYCPDGNPVEISEKKFSGEIYIPENAVLLRTRLREYLHTTNTSYYNHNLLNLISKEIIRDPFGNPTSEKQYEYDTLPLEANSAIHHETPLNGNYRGNRTRSITKLFGGTDIVIENYYDSFGNVIKVKDGNNNQTNYLYTSNYFFAYPESITNAKGQVRANTYSLNTGALLSSIDPNGKRTEYSYDLMGRLIERENPDGGGVIYSYTETAPFSMTSSTKRSASQSVVVNRFYDGFGRLVLTRKADPEGDVLDEISYDPLGRIAQESTPRREGDGPAFTSYQYDVLGRITRRVIPDGNQVEFQYSGLVYKAYDPTGRWREFQYDPLGNLISVDENGLNTTSYQYDVLGNCLSVSQGTQMRTFTYDSASRLISEVHPESGTAGYTYNSNSNLIDSTDAEAVHAHFTYDSLNRTTSVSYSDSTPGISYYYDGENPLEIPCQNPIGRLTGISTQRIKEAFSYDTMGRLIKEIKEIDGQSFEIFFAYDLAGNLVSEVYPSGRVISREINSAGSITGIRDETRERAIASGILHAPFGTIRQKSYGNGIVNSIAFNNRLQPISMEHGNVLDLSYYYYDINGKNNGNVIGITDNLHAEKSASYAYDVLNRLISAVSPSWSQVFNYDINGNMLSKHGTGIAPTADFTYNQQNQINSFSYDANGNLIFDGIRNFDYDADNRLTGTGIYTYVYDSESRRVIKEKNSVPKEINYYIYDQRGLLKAEYQKIGSDPIYWKRDLVYLGSDLVHSAENPSIPTFLLPPTDLVFYYHHDQLGNVRIITDQNGAIAETHDLFPFGEESSGLPPARDQYLFTGKPRDSETGLDYFGERYYSSNIGRFQSVDPGKPNPRIPQTWNKYTYCMNNPLKYIDPWGEYFVVPQGDPHRKAILRALARGALTKSGGELFRSIQRDGRPVIISSGKLGRPILKEGNLVIKTGLTKENVEKGRVTGVTVTLDIKNIKTYHGDKTLITSLYHEVHHVDPLLREGYPAGRSTAFLADETGESYYFGEQVSDEYADVKKEKTKNELAEEEKAITDEIETTQQRMNLFNIIWKSLDRLRSLLFAGAENGPRTRAGGDR